MYLPQKHEIVPWFTRKIHKFMIYYVVKKKYRRIFMPHITP